MTTETLRIKMAAIQSRKERTTFSRFPLVRENRANQRRRKGSPRWFLRVGRRPSRHAGSKNRRRRRKKKETRDVLGAQSEGGRRDGRRQVQALDDLLPEFLVDDVDQAAARNHQIVELVQVQHLLGHDRQPRDRRP